MTSASPTIFALETDSAWVVILAVSVVTLPAALVLRRLIARPGGLASGVLLALPLALPLLAGAVYQHGILPEIGVMRPAGRALIERSGDLLHLLWVADRQTKVVTPYALWGSAGPWLLVLGLGISSFMLLRRIAGTVYVHRLVHRCTPVDERQYGGVLEATRSLSAGAGLTPAPEVLLLPSPLSGAFAVGCRRPRILISQELLESLDDDELEAVLAHEIAHLEARDPWLMCVAGLLRDVVAWNPLGHIALGRLAADRELEADRRAAAMTGKPLAVASGLVKVWEAMLPCRRPRHRAALAFARRGWRVKRRVSKLLALADGGPLIASPGRIHFAIAGSLVALLGFQAGARVAAQGPGAVAFVWGTPGTATHNVWAPTDEPSRVQVTRSDPSRDERSGPTRMTRARYRNFLASVAIPERHFPEWLALARKFARQKPASKAVWEQRRDWQVIPVLPETLGIGVYRIEEGLPTTLTKTPR